MEECKRFITIVAVLLFVFFIITVLDGCAVGSGAKLREYKLDVNMTSGGGVPDFPKSFTVYKLDDDNKVPLDMPPLVCYQCVIIHIDANVPKNVSPTLSTPIIGR